MCCFSIMLFVIIIWIYIPIHNAMSPYTYEFYDVIHGTLNFKDLYIPPDSNTTETDEIDDEEPEEESHQAFFPIQALAASTHDHDLLDFNEISRKLINITRRGSWGEYNGPDDPEDWMYGNYGKIEPKKKMMLIKTNIQFLIHSRYKVYAALKERHAFRADKRYKIGYLFNRLRRLINEMRKIISTASTQNSANPWFKSLTSLMRLYEQVVRLDVDIRDTADYIKVIYNIETAADHVFVKHTTTKNP